MENRKALQRTIEQAFDLARDNGSRCGLLLVRSHDTRRQEHMFGFDVIEQVHNTMYARLQATIRAGDVALPIGECAFAVVLNDIHDPVMVMLAAAKMVRVMRQPIETGRVSSRMDITVGAAIWPDDADTAAEFYQRADASCEHARRKRDGYEVYAGGKIQHMDLSMLHDALRRGELHMQYQPVFAVDTGEVVGFESLSRWQSPTHGWISPGLFVPFAESTGLIHDLTRWSLHAVLQDVSPLLRALPGISCAINISPYSMLEAGLVDQILDATQLWDIAPSSLTVEVTETAFVNDFEAITDVLQRLSREGVRVAIDDYGTGYCSMQYLQNFPVDVLKVDRSFTSELATQERTMHLVEGVVRLAHTIGARVVAEGVENADTLHILAEIGCDAHQGYYMGRPGSLADLQARIKAMQHAA